MFQAELSSTPITTRGHSQEGPAEPHCQCISELKSRQVKLVACYEHYVEPARCLSIHCSHDYMLLHGLRVYIFNCSELSQTAVRLLHHCATPSTRNFGLLCSAEASRWWALSKKRPYLPAYTQGRTIEIRVPVESCSLAFPVCINWGYSKDSVLHQAWIEVLCAGK